VAVDFAPAGAVIRPRVWRSMPATSAQASLSPSRSTARTFQPFCANSSQVARPMPLAAPVTSTALLISLSAVTGFASPLVHFILRSAAACPSSDSDERPSLPP
jgi:hypothetical protein